MWAIAYGVHQGKRIKPSSSWWQILPEGTIVPAVHSEYVVDAERGWWCSPRRCTSTMTPIRAQVSGAVRAYAVPTPPLFVYAPTPGCNGLIVLSPDIIGGFSCVSCGLVLTWDPMNPKNTFEDAHPIWMRIDPSYIADRDTGDEDPR